MASFGYTNNFGGFNGGGIGNVFDNIGDSLSKSLGAYLNFKAMENETNRKKDMDMFTARKLVSDVGLNNAQARNFNIQADSANDKRQAILGLQNKISAGGPLGAGDVNLATLYGAKLPTQRTYLKNAAGEDIGEYVDAAGVRHAYDQALADISRENRLKWASGKDMNGNDLASTELDRIQTWGRNAKDIRALTAYDPKTGRVTDTLRGTVSTYDPVLYANWGRNEQANRNKVNAEAMEARAHGQNYIDTGWASRQNAITNAEYQRTGGVLDRHYQNSDANEAQKNKLSAYKEMRGVDRVDPEALNKFFVGAGGLVDYRSRDQFLSDIGDLKNAHPELEKLLNATKIVDLADLWKEGKGSFALLLRGAQPAAVAKATRGAKEAAEGKESDRKPSPAKAWNGETDYDKSMYTGDR